jgi:hypothetical protein
MFSSQILDVAIGLVFLYCFLSLLCSVIIEMATAMTKKRPRMLKDGINSLLQDSEALKRLYEQPLFMGNTTPKNLLGSLWDSLLAVLPVPALKERVPSYISSRSFVLSLLESLKQHPDVVKNLIFPAKPEQVQEFKAKVDGLTENSGINKELLTLFQGDDQETFAKIHTWYDQAKNNPDLFKKLLETFKWNIPNIENLENIKRLVEALPSDNAIKRTLTPLMETAGKGADALDKALDRMEKWYDEAMDRVTGWYKRYSQAFAMGLALIIALALNADTFEIGKALYRDPPLRASIVAMAEDQVKKGTLSNEQGVPDRGRQGAHPTPATQNSQKAQQTAASPLTPGPRAPKSGTKKAAQPPISVGAIQPAASTPSLVLPAISPREQDKALVKRLRDLNTDIKKMETLNLPLGWDRWWEQWKKQLIHQNIYNPNKDEIDSYLQFLWFFINKSFWGILFTAFMVSLGSNFWFELLNKLVNMRNAGQKPATKEEREAQKA